MNLTLPVPVPRWDILDVNDEWVHYENWHGDLERILTVHFVEGSSAELMDRPAWDASIPKNRLEDSPFLQVSRSGKPGRRTAYCSETFHTRSEILLALCDAVSWFAFPGRVRTRTQQGIQHCSEPQGGVSRSGYEVLPCPS